MILRLHFPISPPDRLLTRCRTQSDSFPPTGARRAAREIAKSRDAVGQASCWARCRASSSQPRLTVCWTLSSGRRCPTASRNVGRGVDALSNFLKSLGSRLGGGSARLANPQRRCAAGMSRRARPAGHRRKPKDAPCFKAFKQCLEKWAPLRFNASFTVRKARFTVRNARFTFKNATPANESYPAGYTRTSVYPAGYDSRERAPQRA